MAEPADRMTEDPSPSYAELWHRVRQAEEAVELLTAQKNALYAELAAVTDRTERDRQVIDALAAQCPACLAAPGERCYATSTDEPRRHPHRLRGLAAAKRLRQCEHCGGIGWRPDTERTDHHA